MTADETSRGTTALEAMLAADASSIASLLVDRVEGYAIFVLDPHGYVRTWNRGAQRLKGYAPEEIIGTRFSRFYTEEDRARGTPDVLLARAEAEGAAEHSGWRVRADGSTFWGDVTITALRDDAGTLLGFAKVTRDRTAVHEHEEALRLALDREREAVSALDRLARTRSRFLAAVVHDLSTPITIIRGNLAMLLADLDPDEGHDDGGTRELLTGARRNAEDLEKLRAQLQELARLEGGSLALELTPLPLAQLAREVAEDVGRATDTSILVDVDPTTEVLADELALRRILTNLATNAVRYSPPHAPVRIVTGPAEHPEQIAVGVVDEGPGIDPAEQERVFLEFWSGRGGSRSHGGLGLGLNIVQGYVTEHGGRVWIDSEVGEGATFWFTLHRAANP